MMNMTPLHAEDAVASGLIDGAKHRLNAMYDIQHLMPYGIAKAAAVGSERDNRLPGSETLAVPSTDTQSDRSTPSEAGPSGRVVAASASDISGLKHDGYQKPYMLQNAAERAHLLQQCEVSMSDQKRLADKNVHVRQGYYDRKFGFNTAVADVCMFASSKPEEASEAKLHSHRGCLTLDIDDYAKLIQKEASSAAEKAANAAPTDAKPKINPTVAVVHIEGRFW